MTTPNNTVAGLAANVIEQGWRDSFSTNNPFCPCDLKSFTKAVRWAERALASHAPSAGVGVEEYRGSPVDDLRENLQFLAVLASRADQNAALHFVGKIKGALAEDQRIRAITLPAAPSAPPSVAGAAGELPLEDRVEFALRDAGFDYDEAFRISRLATAEQPGSAVQGELVGELIGYGWISGDAQVRIRRDLPPGTKLYISAPPAPAAEQGPAWKNPAPHAAPSGLAAGFAYLNATQPEARGVDGVPTIISDIRHSALVDDYEPQQIAFLESIAARLTAALSANEVSRG